MHDVQQMSLVAYAVNDAELQNDKTIYKLKNGLG